MQVGKSEKNKEFQQKKEVWKKAIRGKNNKNALYTYMKLSKNKQIMLLTYLQMGKQVKAIWQAVLPLLDHWRNKQTDLKLQVLSLSLEIKKVREQSR